MSLLEVRGARVRYRQKERAPVVAVDGVDLRVEPGQIVGLVGESGCGKSSLARAVMGMEPLDDGTVTFDGRPVGRLGWSRRPRHDLGLQMVFQDPYSSLNPRRTVGSQLLDSVARSSGVERRRQVGDLLDRVGLDRAAAHRYPHEFSGGQRQRVAIARVLAAAPRLIVADEPVTSLDASSQAQIVNLLLGLVRDLDMGMLFISHDLALVHEIADRTAVMYLGHVVEEGPTGQVWDAPWHPYTRALIDAVPAVGPDAGLPRVLAGDVPDPANRPPGCPFAPRCARATPECTGPIPHVEVGDRRAWCLHPLAEPAPVAHTGGVT